MGQRDAFSALDIEKVKKMYKCSDNEILDTHRPGINNNIAEITEEENSSTGSTSTTTPAPTSSNRPNRPILNLLGGLISQALSQG